jgi:hypothetical protein
MGTSRVVSTNREWVEVGALSVVDRCRRCRLPSSSACSSAVHTRVAGSGPRACGRVGGEVRQGDCVEQTDEAKRANERSHETGKLTVREVMELLGHSRSETTTRYRQLGKSGLKDSVRAAAAVIEQQAAQRRAMDGLKAEVS